MKISAKILMLFLAHLFLSTSNASTTKTTEANRQLVAKVKKALEKEDMQKNNTRGLRTPITKTDKMNVKEVDLNYDGKKEILVLFEESCEDEGCQMYIISHDLKIISKHTAIKAPIFLESQAKNGWRVIKLYSNNAWRKLAHNGRRYPSHPLVAPETRAPTPNAEIIFEEQSKH